MKPKKQDALVVLGFGIAFYGLLMGVMASVNWLQGYGFTWVF